MTRWLGWRIGILVGLVVLVVAGGLAFVKYRDIRKISETKVEFALGDKEAIYWIEGSVANGVEGTPYQLHMIRNGKTDSITVDENSPTNLTLYTNNFVEAEGEYRDEEYVKDIIWDFPCKGKCPTSMWRKMLYVTEIKPLGIIVRDPASISSLRYSVNPRKATAIIKDLPEVRKAKTEVFLDKVDYANSNWVIKAGRELYFMNMYTGEINLF